MNRRHSVWKTDALPLSYTRMEGGGQTSRAHARHLFVLVVNKNQPHGRGLAPPLHAFLTGMQKPGGNVITRTRASFRVLPRLTEGDSIITISIDTNVTTKINNII